MLTEKAGYKTASRFPFHFGKRMTKRERKRRINRYAWKGISHSVSGYLWVVRFLNELYLLYISS